MQTFGKKTYDTIELDPWKRAAKPVAHKKERKPLPALRIVAYAVALIGIGAVLYTRLGPFLSA